MKIIDQIDLAFSALERRREPKESPDVANCDCCDEQPGVRMIQFGGMDTWICDECSDLTPRRRVPRFHTREDYEAYEAGVPARGEI